MDATVGTEEVTLCWISNHSTALTPLIRFTLKIATDFTWTLFFSNQRIETNRCPTLASKEPLLRSPANVADLTAAIDGSCLVLVTQMSGFNHCWPAVGCLWINMVRNYMFFFGYNVDV